MAAREAPQRPRRRLDRRAGFVASACVGCPRRALSSARRRGLLGPALLRRARARQITYAVGAPLIASVTCRIARSRAGDWRPRATATAARSRASAGGRRRGSGSAASSSAATRQARRATHARRSRLALLGATYQRHERSADELECWHRAKANVENGSRRPSSGSDFDNLPCPSFHANWAYLLCTLPRTTCSPGSSSSPSPPASVAAT